MHRSLTLLKYPCHSLLNVRAMAYGGQWAGLVNITMLRYDDLKKGEEKQ